MSLLAEERSPRPGFAEICQFGYFIQLPVLQEILGLLGAGRAGGVGTSHLGISPQRVEQLLGRLVTLAATPLSETGSNFIEGPAFCLRNFEVGEDEEQNQEHSEDDEDVRTTQLLEDTDILG